MNEKKLSLNVLCTVVGQLGMCTTRPDQQMFKNYLSINLVELDNNKIGAIFLTGHRMCFLVFGFHYPICPISDKLLHHE